MNAEIAIALTLLTTASVSTGAKEWEAVSRGEEMTVYAAASDVVHDPVNARLDVLESFAGMAPSLNGVAYRSRILTYAYHCAESTRAMVGWSMRPDPLGGGVAVGHGEPREVSFAPVDTGDVEEARLLWLACQAPARSVQ